MLNFLFEHTPLHFMTQSLWRDEAFSYLMSRMGVLEIVTATAHDFTPPLYYLLLHFWMRLFGSGEVALRSLSLVFFASTVFVVWLFLQNVLKVDKKKIWSYLLVIAVNPFLIYYAFEARPYSLLALLASLSFYFFIQGRHKMYAVATILGLYTHYFFIFVVSAQVIHLLLFDQKAQEKRKFVTLSLLLFLPWFVYIYPTIASRTSDFWINALSFTKLVSSLSMVFTGYESSSGLVKSTHVLTSLVLIALIGFFIYKKSSSRTKLFKILFLWSVVFPLLIFAVSMVKPILTPRYVIFAVVGLNLLIFYILENTGRRTRLAVLAFILFINVSFNLHQVYYRRKGNIRRTAREIASLATERDSVYVSNLLLYFPALYYFDEERVYIYKTDSDPIPYYIGAVLVDADKIVRRLPAYPSKAFIIIDDERYVIQTGHY